MVGSSNWLLVMGRKVCPSNWLLEVGQTACLAAITITIVRLSGLFFVPALILSIPTRHPSVLTFLICSFILFYSCCSHERVFGKTFVHKFEISHSHTECYLFFYDSATTSAHRESGAI